MIYTLQYNGITARIDSIGAELISLQKGGHEYIWIADPSYWNGHNPNLFPVIGFLKDNKTCFNGVEFQIPKHGYARKTEFALLETGDRFITLRMTDSDETRTGYPFRFHFDITHRLTENGFITNYRIENCSNTTMHFMIGGHTGIALPFTEGVAFEDHTVIFEAPESNVTRYIAVNGQYINDSQGESNFLDGADRLPLNYSLFDEDALMLAGLQSRRLTLWDPFGRGVGFEFEGFDALGIWTPPGKQAPFICIEPWNGINAFVDEEPEFSKKPFIRSIEAGEIYSVSYRVQIID